MLKVIQDMLRPVCLTPFVSPMLSLSLSLDTQKTSSRGLYRGTVRTPWVGGADLLCPISSLKMLSVCVCVGMGPRGKKKEVVAHSLTLITLACLSQCVLV